MNSNRLGAGLGVSTNEFRGVTCEGDAGMGIVLREFTYSWPAPAAITY
jgi:hypothetical protein